MFVHPILYFLRPTVHSSGSQAREMALLKAGNML
jgi:hypothetical protein